MSERLHEVLGDVTAESEALDALVADLDEAGWRTPTPAAGWDVGAQIAHLWWTDRAAVLAATDKAGWDQVVLEAMADPDGFVDASALGSAHDPELLGRWRESRAALGEALLGVPAGERLPWFGPPMSPTSMATARYMETWAHGLDVAEALGVEVEPTDRIRHVAHIGVRTRAFAFAAHDLPAPEEIRVELVAPSGDLWTWGPEDAEQRLTGPAHDFCLRVTQRRHRDDLALVAHGAAADTWLDVAQCFAGPPGRGRPPRGEGPQA